MEKLNIALILFCALPQLCFGTMTPDAARLAKSFSVQTAPVGLVTVLAFQVTNPNQATSLNMVAFNDNLPPGMTVASPNGTTSTCVSAVTAVSGATSISVLIGTLAPGTCTITVNVVSSTSGIKVNTTSAITATGTFQGDPATATITITALPAFLVSYFPNLNVADSVINLTNPGSDGAGLAAGTTASTTGAVCANVYAFSPDEQMISCCSCPVTPNGLVSLSVQRDLISNTLTPAVPTSIVVKLVASPPVGGSCQGSAAALATFSNSINAWGTKVHGGATPGTLATTEVPFSWAQLSPGEADRLRQLCTYINSNGSGFGVCRSCRLGGLGAGRL